MPNLGNSRSGAGCQQLHRLPEVGNEFTCRGVVPMGRCNSRMGTRGRSGMSAEAHRVAALLEYELLDRPPDSELEALVRVAACVADVPNATLNLLDDDRQCQLATVGFEGRDTARSDSMCARHFLDGAVVHLPDARRSPEYADSPWVTG